MKALPMFDNLMLWIARVFAVVILVYGMFEFLFAFAAPNTSLPLRHLPGLSTADYRALLFRVGCLETSLGGFYLACLFLLHSRISRILFGVTAGYFLLRNSISLYYFCFVFHFSVIDWKATTVITLTALTIILYLIFIRLAFRPPATSHDSSPDIRNLHKILHLA